MYASLLSIQTAGNAALSLIARGKRSPAVCNGDHQVINEPRTIFKTLTPAVVWTFERLGISIFVSRRFNTRTISKTVNDDKRTYFEKPFPSNFHSNRRIGYSCRDYGTFGSSRSVSPVVGYYWFFFSFLIRFATYARTVSDDKASNFNRNLIDTWFSYRERKKIVNTTTKIPRIRYTTAIVCRGDSTMVARRLRRLKIVFWLFVLVRFSNKIQ